MYISCCVVSVKRMSIHYIIKLKRNKKATSKKKSSSVIVRSAYDELPVQLPIYEYMFLELHVASTALLLSPQPYTLYYIP